MSNRRSRRTPRPPHEARRWVAWVIVAVLAVGVGALSVFALQQSREDPYAGETVAPVPTFTPRSTSTPDSSPSPEAPAAVQIDPSTVRFLAVGDDAIWRAVAGSCTGADPLLEKSTDGGATFADITPLYRGVTQILSLDGFAGTEAEIVATASVEDDDTDCTPQALRTFTQGSFWEFYPEVLAESTYLNPQNPGQVVTPAGDVATPCASPTSLRSVSGTAAVTCDDGTASVLADDQTWSQLPISGALTVGLTSDTLAVATTDASCSGILVTRFATGDLSTPEASQCAEGTDPAQPVAVAPDDTATLVWAGDALVTLQ
ncbi:hypothetical protein FHX48_001876 [Microbacterium halimionae]|uniref:Uncharacterized protein n=1 Tax=Microbacterium halimionae TaxID=1526413 RepID=A0A7W3JQ02_9MICO|nr:hypothetical protein [Microbacterium halimionae]MBA8816783.1 hypothetical protein [Microbacterium halimionae]NII94921.1 hypothetical protein [Microbacterium halimionae]